MARARFIRPEFFTDEKVSDLSLGAALLFAGIWCHSDLRGVYEHNPRLLRGLIYPMRDQITTDQVAAWLGEIERAGMVRRFCADGKSWGHVKNWSKHQQISGKERSIGSKRPLPPDVGTDLEQAQPCPGTDPGQTQPCPGTDPGQTRAATATATATPTPTPTVTLPPPRARAEEAAPPSPSTSGRGEVEQAKPSAEENMASLFGPDPPAPKDIVHRERTLGDFQAFHPRIYVGRDERDAWQALLARYQWDAMEDGYKTLVKDLPREKRVLFSMISKWLGENYTITD
jgi:hypothetical protein